MSGYLLHGFKVHDNGDSNDNNCCVFAAVIRLACSDQSMRNPLTMQSYADTRLGERLCASL